MPQESLEAGVAELIGRIPTGSEFGKQNPYQARRPVSCWDIRDKTMVSLRLLQVRHQGGLMVVQLKSIHNESLPVRLQKFHGAPVTQTGVPDKIS